ncbi:MAG: type II secretion system protein [Phycisphaerae bacterium]
MNGNTSRIRCGLRPGYTLLEILTVVGILTMLIGLLLPSLHRAREQTRETQCLNRLHSLFVAHVTYLEDYKQFPPMNNEADDGSWQYNYLVFDGKDYHHNFGPLIADGATLDEIKILYCPTQEDIYHSLNTAFNPWPAVKNTDTRAGYGRRYHLSGKSLSQLRRTIGFAADIFHLPEVVKSAHKTGVNAVYTDGHGQWVHDPGLFTHNELASPFDPLDNRIMRKLWRIVDEAK